MPPENLALLDDEEVLRRAAAAARSAATESSTAVTASTSPVASATASAPAAAPVAAAQPEIPDAIRRLFLLGERTGVSDYHLDEGLVPAWRLNGEMHQLKQLQPVTAADIHALLAVAGKNAAEPCDCMMPAGSSLYRLNYDRSREGMNIVLRHVRKDCPALDELDVPPKFVELALDLTGVLVVSGLAGEGKTTTMNSLIGRLNERSPGLAITIIGDPIEFYHEPKEARIRHREYDRDFTSYEKQLANVMRQDPDVICISEARGWETFEVALRAGDTGHLVILTMHSGSAVDTLSRLVDMAPSSDKEHVRALVLRAWKATLWQTLVPTNDGKRVAAFELLTNTTAVANGFRENMLHQIENEMLVGTAASGMVHLDMSLRRLLEDNRISEETARAYFRRKDFLE